MDQTDATAAVVYCMPSLKRSSSAQAALLVLTALGPPKLQAMHASVFPLDRALARGELCVHSFRACQRHFTLTPASPEYSFRADCQSAVD